MLEHQNVRTDVVLKSSNVKNVRTDCMFKLNQTLEHQMAKTYIYSKLVKRLSVENVRINF